jgi:hypothetical protein
MRPTFEVALRCRPEALLAAFRRRLDSGHAPLRGLVTRRHVFLRIPKSRQHFWSPRLELELRPSPDEAQELGGTQPRTLHGRFTPHPNVWGLFMAIYLLLGIAGCAGLVWGLSQWTLGQTPWALAAVPLSIALIGFVYGAAFIGQGLGSEQMYELRSFVDDVQRNCEHDCGTADEPAVRVA